VRKATLYSRSSRPRPPGERNAPAPAAPPAPAALPRKTWPHWRKAFTGLALAGIAAALFLAWPAPHQPLTQEDIDAAVMRTLENSTLPSRMARAYDVIRPSVVRVRGLGKDEMGEEVEQSVGTGVVIVDSGIILTNLHVVVGAPKLVLEFADGLESEASVIGLQPEQDLAVLQAKTIPDDLVAATMR
jgi:S1-C subfamily serine protease